ncbi:S-adenosyl-L-methionine-dependent methyltransferase [Hypomontagnella submonticulosa]|nr:S-adenosyl-L-methionine-dependent methyltransferase [Hypomontagnella submonticulosa]
MTTSPQPLTQLQSHFMNRDRNNQPSGWTELWDTNQSYFWDRGQPSPALVDWIESRPKDLPSVSDRRLTALVPGCGKGYDVVMLALHGFDVYGVEVSHKAVEIAEAYAATELHEPSAYNFPSEDAPPPNSTGRVKFVECDFFKAGWEKRVMGSEFQGFDLIYDYTFLCALPPDMRKDWARRMSDLLSPTGTLVCLEFPLYKDLKAPGPPWGLKGVHSNILAEGGNGIINEESEGKTGQLQGRFERVAYFKPPRTHEVGMGTDMMSIWKLKSDIVV